MGDPFRIVNIWLSLALALAPLGTFADSHCEHTALLSSLSMEVRLVLDTRETAASELVPLSGGRLAYATTIADVNGRTIGGRLVIHDWEKNHPAVALHPPLEAFAPGAICHVVRSPDEQRLALIGPIVLGGPVTLFDADPLSVRAVGQEVRRPFDAVVDALTEMYRLADKQDPVALAQIRVFDPNLDGLRLLHTRPAQLRLSVELLAEKCFDRGGDANTPKNIPVLGVQFHPDGTRYLVDTGGFAIVRSARNGGEIQRLSLHSRRAPHVHDVPVNAYLGGGAYVASVSQNYVTLWDAERADFLDALTHPTQLRLAAAPIVSSPKADLLSAAFTGARQNVRILWAVDPRGAKVAVQRQIVSAHTPTTRNEFPQIAFSRTGRYAVATPHGRVEIASAPTHHAQHVYQLGDDIPVDRVDLSDDGKWLAVAARTGDGGFVELRSADSLRGVHLSLPPAPAYHAIRVRGLRFTPDGGGLLVDTFVVDPRNPGAPANRTPYFVDVARAMALVTAPGH